MIVLAQIPIAMTQPPPAPTLMPVVLTARKMSAYIRTQTLGTILDGQDLYVGFYFVADFDVTVLSLGRWKLPGNAETHNVRIIEYVDGAAGDIELGLVTVDTLGKSEGYVYADLSSPVPLTAGTTYYLLSEEHLGGDQFYDWDDTIPDTFTTGIGTLSGALYKGTLSGAATLDPGPSSFGPLNFTIAAPWEQAGFEESLTFDQSLWEAVTAQTRWTRGRVTLEGDSVLTTRVGAVEVVDTLDPSQQKTATFHVIGRNWALPSELMWGNRAVEVYLGLAKNPRLLKERKIFSGFTFQKSSKGDAPVLGDITCVDRSIAYSGIPVCYSLGAFAGKYRGEIVRELARFAGFDDAHIHVPLGKVVQKPILLNDASLLAFVAEFGLCENWFPYVDEEGNFIVEIIGVKARPDWVLDASKGDFYLESFQDTPPTRPPCRLYITAELPVPTTGASGDPSVVTKVTEEIDFALHNPQCVKVRPSGGASFLQGDGSYRSLPEQVFMAVAKVVTQVTTAAGVEVQRVVSTWAMYNPAAYDTNFNSAPPTSSYDAAYGDKTFHRDEVESLMEISRETTEILTDIHDTIQRQVTTTLGWHAPQHALVFSDGTNTYVVNSGGAYIYAGLNARSIPEEIFQTVGIVESNYGYAPDGTLFAVDEIASFWTAPKGRSDVIKVAADGVPIAGLVVPTTPILPAFPPDSPFRWKPNLTGPYNVPFSTRRDLDFLFRLELSGLPAGTTAYGNFSLATGSIYAVARTQFSGAETQDDGTWRKNIGSGLKAISFDQSVYRFEIRTNGNTPLPANYVNSYIEISVTLADGPEAGVHTARLNFNPFEGLAPGEMI